LGGVFSYHKKVVKDLRNYGNFSGNQKYVVSLPIIKKSKSMEFDQNGIAMGTMPEDLKNRKRFITDFYVNWIIANPTKHIYNNSLKSFIEVKFLSMQETASRAAIRYRSTLVITYLTEILENAVIAGKPQEPKKDNVKQKRFF